MTEALKLKLPVSNFWSLVRQKLLLPMHHYRKKIIAFSGGKDSLALTLALLDWGVPRDEIELWHHLIDAPKSARRFDWPVTESYVRAIGHALGIPVRFSWKEDGFEGELFREKSRTKGVYYEDMNRVLRYLPPQQPSKYCRNCRRYFDNDTQYICPECGEWRYGFDTRMKYPMAIADLDRRWCSAYLKIDVCRRIISNDAFFKEGEFLILTGERRQESDARELYDETVPYKRTKKRRVDQWRMVIDWKEQHVWDIIERHRLRPHPCYYLGFSRCSCMCCIFSDRNQWHTIKRIAPETFDWHARNERRFGLTIKQGQSIDEQAACGSNLAEDAPQELIDLALSDRYPQEMAVLGKDEPWVLPSGAYKKTGGPT